MPNGQTAIFEITRDDLRSLLEEIPDGTMVHLRHNEQTRVTTVSELRTIADEYLHQRYNVEELEGDSYMIHLEFGKDIALIFPNSGLREIVMKYARKYKRLP